MKVSRNNFGELIEFDLQEVVAKNARRLISQSGLTVEELSIKTNLSAATINRIKAGQNLSIHSICIMADVLGGDWRVFFA